MAGKTGPTQFTEPNIITIGTQTWTNKNLQTAFYNNGDAIPEVQDTTQWANLTTGAWCYYNNDPALGAIYGKLYNWYAANDPRGITPQGWHVPTEVEWTTLQTHLGGVSVAGGPLKAIGTVYWLSPNSGATDSSGFTALGAGRRGSAGGFLSIQALVGFWSSNEVDSTNANRWGLGSSVSSFGPFSINKLSGYSIRCIKD